MPYEKTCSSCGGSGTKKRMLTSGTKKCGRCKGTGFSDYERNKYSSGVERSPDEYYYEKAKEKYGGLL